MLFFFYYNVGDTQKCVIFALRTFIIIRIINTNSLNKLMKKIIPAIAVALCALVSVNAHAQKRSANLPPLSPAQIQHLRDSIISAYETQRARTMDWARFRRYQKQNDTILMREKESKQRPEAVLMGNSITELWVELDADWLRKHNLVGRGISGQVSSQMLVRFRRDVIDLNPKRVVILCGINDIALNQGRISVENIMGNIQSMVELARVHKIKPYLCTTPPAARIGWRSEVKDAPQQIAQLNNLIRAYAQKERIPLIDYFPLLVDADGVSMKKEYTHDGLHPTLPGYKVMEKALLQALKIR